MQTSLRCCRSPSLVPGAPRLRAVASSALPSWVPIFGSKEANMGSSNSKEWTASPEGSPKEPKISQAGYDVTPLTLAERKEIAKELTPRQRAITLEAGTEGPFSGKTVNGYPHDNKAKGVYVSAIGDLPLFHSDTKFDSGTGWPSFYAPLDPEHVIEIKDSSMPFMERVEVVCAKSGAHLGHVFNDGPRPTGLRYCMNAAALKFIPQAEFEQQEKK